MEVYILDSLFRREQVVDSFESLIWTERWAEFGDFELNLPSTLASRTTFIPGVRLAMNESRRVMTVETVEDSTDEEGQATLTVKGRSLEALMEDRVAKANGITPNGPDGGKYTINGYPIDIVNTLIYNFLIVGVLNVADRYPFLSIRYNTGDSIPKPNTFLMYQHDDSSVAEMVLDIAKTYEFGFRIVRPDDTSALYFEVYTGNDLTSAQTARRAVIFSPSFDNLQNTKELVSIEDAKNVAYVISENDAVIVYGIGADANTSGFDRKVMLYQSDEIPPLEGGSNNEGSLRAYIQQQGLAELLKHRAVSVFDGEMNQNGEYRYGVDYNLGDRVEVRNADGAITTRRVTEQIFVSDPEGERSYPTLSEADGFLSTDTWNYQGGTVWAEKTDTEYWSTE